MPTQTQGIYIQQSFPFGAFGCRQWSLSEMKRLLRWLKSLGYNRVIFGPWPTYAEEVEGYNVLETGALMNSGLRGAAPLRPGNRYCPGDRYLGTKEGLENAAQLRDAMAYARDIGLGPWISFAGTIGPPQFCEEHPELLSAAPDSNVFLEGLGLCPSKPKALQFLLKYNEEQIRYLDSLEGVAMFLRDAGGCHCAACQPQDQALPKLASTYHTMIKGVSPELQAALISWHIHISEVPTLAAKLPPDMLIFEAPRIHAIDVPQSEFVERVKRWQESGRRVEGWIEVQENPTALLPTVYPDRLSNMIGLMKDLGLSGLWGTATQNPYLFPLNIWMAMRLWNGCKPAEALITDYFTESFGKGSVEPGRRYLTEMEKAWDLAQGESQREAGFLKIFVLSLPRRMLPEKCIQEGVPEAFRSDSGKAVAHARRALEAAEDMADAIREFHALDANTIVAGAEVFYWMVRMRDEKIPVLDALHRGDVEEAARGWKVVERAAEEVVAACRNAPNTDVLADHWRRLSLLPERVRSLRKLLPELAERKRFQQAVRPHEMRETYP